MPLQKNNLVFNFFISALAVWRVSSLLVHEDGPGEVFAKLRTISGVKYNQLSIPYGTNLLSNILVCVWCTSIWVAGFIAILDKPVKLHIYIQRVLSLSAAAIMFETLVRYYRFKSDE